MSSIWTKAHAGEVRPVGISDYLAAAGGGFRAHFADAVPPPPIAPVAATEPAELLDPVDQAHADGFTMGFQEGHRIAIEAAAEDQAARTRLAEALEQLSPASSGTLAAMLSATVVRLVGEIAGSVEIDEDLLRQRCAAVASFIDDSECRGALHIHPADAPLLEGADIAVPIVADPQLRRGSIRLDTVDGWIEDGPDVRLSRLKALLDDMEGKL